MTLFNKRIFISPLDWGLGHASRCVPIIHHLKKKNTVIIGTTPLNAFLFENYFPDLEQLTVPSYKIRYTKYFPLWLKLVFQWPKINKAIKLESKILQDIIEKQKIDLVISDNRFGLFSKSIPSVFITHQLNIQTPFLTSFINKINRKFIHQFNEVWVPDVKTPNERLAGVLSDSRDIKIPVKYIGPQSALSFFSNELVTNKIDVLMLLSGIEPLRTELEKVLLQKTNDTPKKIVLVRGTNNGVKLNNPNVQVINFAFGEDLKNLISNAETVICRSGYSTLMDLNFLNKTKIILIPTPGQTEQLYLAKFWKTNFGADVVEMKELKKSFKIH